MFSLIFLIFMVLFAIGVVPFTATWTAVLAGVAVLSAIEVSLA